MYRRRNEFSILWPQNFFCDWCGVGRTRLSVFALLLGLSLGLGATLGLALGFALGKPMSAALLGVASWDAVVSITVVTILWLTCTAAAFLPALKALRVDPVEALRAE